MMPSHELLKAQYLSEYYHKSPRPFKLLQLLGSDHVSTLVGLAIYISNVLYQSVIIAKLHETHSIFLRNIFSCMLTYFINLYYAFS